MNIVLHSPYLRRRLDGSAGHYFEYGSVQLLKLFHPDSVLHQRFHPPPPLPMTIDYEE
jgi:hypothetical protein